ncbi:MAG: hypothetical protein JXX29_05235 [Deltaproteobacteria bacterium]|nr:hypothetical protein [Deltaproteobacteria bacterium]MBN2671051.1 hypothetical protein [Deltaproteobacteria bacterium]
MISNPSINWRDSALQTDQEIVECLSTSLGRPVGYGENATGGYNASGGSNLVIITKSSGTSVEQQIADAVSSADYNWIVFDKNDFANPTEVAMYRLFCNDSAVLSQLGTSDANECLDYNLWCANHGVSSADCEDTFFNSSSYLNTGDDLPITNVEIFSNTTIDGRGSEAYFLFNGFKIGSDDSGSPVNTAQNVILTNLKFVGAGHVEDHNLDPDMIRSTGASHDIWIHQNTFDHTGDSAFDVKVGAYDITVSFNKLVDVKRAALHGSSDSREINAQIRTTIHNNAFITRDENYGLDEYGNTARRVPLIRRGMTHLFNNVFYNYRKEVMSVRVGAMAEVENSVFMVNMIEADDQKGDDMADLQESIFGASLDDGGLSISGTHLWDANSSCQMNTSATLPLNAAYGSATPDLSNDYSSQSQSTISANWFDAGPDLVDYVLATAGKGGATPYVSTYSPGESAIFGMSYPNCQE